MIAERDRGAVGVDPASLGRTAIGAIASGGTLEVVGVAIDPVAAGAADGQIVVDRRAGEAQRVADHEQAASLGRPAVAVAHAEVKTGARAAEDDVGRDRRVGEADRGPRGVDATALGRPTVAWRTLGWAA